VEKIYLVCGVAACGKSWACRQAAERFHYIPHDRCWVMPGSRGWDPGLAAAADTQDHSAWAPGAKSNHLEVLLEAAKIAEKPVLTECPFAERVLRDALEARGIEVIPIFVVEKPSVCATRYLRREGKPIPQAARTRAATIGDRAKEWGAFSGTSDEVLAHLKEIPL